MIILTVPHLLEGIPTIEHFPELYRWTLIPTPTGYRLDNITHDGRYQSFSNVNVHDGDGTRVEMRYFTQQSLLTELHRAGFKHIKIHRDSEPRYRIYWPQH